MYVCVYVCVGGPMCVQVLLKWRVCVLVCVCVSDENSCDPRAYCPPQCKCSGTEVRCSHQQLNALPQLLPLDTTELYDNAHSCSSFTNSYLHTHIHTYSFIKKVFIFNSLYFIQLINTVWLGWCNVVGSINKVNQRRARLVLGWVTVGRRLNTKHQPVCDACFFQK